MIRTSIIASALCLAGCNNPEPTPTSQPSPTPSATPRVLPMPRASSSSASVTPIAADPAMPSALTQTGVDMQQAQALVACKRMRSVLGRSAAGSFTLDAAVAELQQNPQALVACNNGL